MADLRDLLSPPDRRPPPVPTEHIEARPRPGSNSSTETITLALPNRSSNTPLFSKMGSLDYLLEEEILAKIPKPPSNSPESATPTNQNRPVSSFHSQNAIRVAY